MNKVGQVRAWEFTKIMVRDRHDAERTAQVMADAGWQPVCTSQVPITLKRPDGRSIIQPPRRNYYIEHDMSAAIGDVAVSGWV